MEVIFAGMLLGWEFNSQKMKEVEIESNQTHLNIHENSGPPEGKNGKKISEWIGQ